MEVKGKPQPKMQAQLKLIFYSVKECLSDENACAIIYILFVICNVSLYIFYTKTVNCPNGKGKIDRSIMNIQRLRQLNYEVVRVVNIVVYIVDNVFFLSSLVYIFDKTTFTNFFYETPS